MITQIFGYVWSIYYEPTLVIFKYADFFFDVHFASDICVY